MHVSWIFSAVVQGVNLQYCVMALLCSDYGNYPYSVVSYSSTSYTVPCL